MFSFCGCRSIHKDCENLYPSKMFHYAVFQAMSSVLVSSSGFAIPSLFFLQTLLQTEILKNQLQIANNLKSTVATSSPGPNPSQLLSSMNNSPASNTSPSTSSNLGEFCCAMAGAQAIEMLLTLILLHCRYLIDSSIQF